MTTYLKPSEVLGMTLPMFDVLTIQGPNNAKTITNIYANLTVLKKSLDIIEEKYPEIFDNSEEEPVNDNNYE